MQETLSPRLGPRRATRIVGICGLVLAPICGIVTVLTFFPGMPIFVLLPSGAQPGGGHGRPAGLNGALRNSPGSR